MAYDWQDLQWKAVGPLARGLPWKQLIKQAGQGYVTAPVADSTAHVHAINDCEQKGQLNAKSTREPLILAGNFLPWSQKPQGIFNAGVPGQIHIQWLLCKKTPQKT